MLVRPSLGQRKNYSTGWLQSPQKRNQVLLLRRRQLETERMTGNRARLPVITFEARRHVIGIQPRGIEPFFERHRRAGVAERAALPAALERWHFVETCALMAVERVARVTADVARHYLIGSRSIAAIRRHQFVVGLQRRRVANHAGLALK